MSDNLKNISYSFKSKFNNKNLIPDYYALNYNLKRKKILKENFIKTNNITNN